MSTQAFEPIERSGACLTAPPVGPWPIHHFRLSELGIDQGEFVRNVRPSFDRTAWDMYDVVNRQIAYLQQHATPAVAAEAARLSTINPGERADGVQKLSELLDDETRAGLARFAPHRRRAMRKYRCRHQGGARWSIELSNERTFMQAVKDFRAKPREFALIEPEVSTHDGILTLLTAASETARRYRPDAKQIDAVLHQMTVFAKPREASAPAPEGVHQDGADFIVSAIVIERTGVSGGVSRVREGRDGPAVLEVELAPGEGIFQADSGSPLWHEVSPIALTGAETSGHRMILGFDINVS